MTNQARLFVYTLLQKKKKFYLKPILVILSGVPFLFCSQENKTIRAYLTYISGTVSVNNSSASVGQIINAGDTVATDKSSNASIQISTGAIILMRENSSISIEKIDRAEQENKKFSAIIHHKKGFIFNKIEKGSSDFSVHTPTAVAGVRGTSFSSQIDENSSSFMLLHGKIQIQEVSDKEGKTIELNDNQKIIFSDEIKKPEIQELTELETKGLSSLDEIKFLSQEELETQDSSKNETNAKKVIPENALQELNQNYNNSNSASEDKSHNKISIQSLKAKYGQLTVLETKDGKKYTGGGWTQQGEYHVLETVNGTVRIKSSNVMKITPAN